VEERRPPCVPLSRRGYCRHNRGHGDYRQCGLTGSPENLETAIDSRLDDRLETVDLLSDPTAALFAIRKKWEDNQPLTRAEWIVLGHYVQSGCDHLSSDPELPSCQSFAQLLEALLAIRELRHHPAL
jgi:hypothetical protein